MEHANLFQVVKFFSGFTFRNSQYKDLSSKYVFLTFTESADSIKICLTVIIVLHATQTGYRITYHNEIKVTNLNELTCEVKFVFL